MKMSKHSPEMTAALNDVPSITVKETMIAGIMMDDDELPPAVVFLARTCDDRISAVVLKTSSEVAEVAQGLLEAAKVVFGTDEHQGSKGTKVN